MKQSVAGVYQIRNRVTGEVYIGTSVDIPTRVRGHLSMLKTGWHHNSRLQADWNTFGPSSFAFCLLDVTTDDDDMIAVERRWIETLRPRVSGLYNAMTPRNGPREARRRAMRGLLCQQEHGRRKR